MPEYSLTWHRGKYALTFQTDEGKRKRISTGTDDPGRADAVAKEIWRRINAAPSERVADLWPRYVQDRIAEGARADRFKAHWTALEPHFGDKVGNAITREECREFYKVRKALNYADSTIKTDLEMLRACLRWRYDKQAPKIWVGTASPPRDAWLTKEQARALVDLTDTPHIKLFLILALTTGARSGAILDLTWGRVDFDHGTIDYRPAGRKITNKRRVVVPMNAQTKSALEEAYEGRLTDNVIEYNGKPVQSVKKAIQRLAIRSGVKFSPHTLRHTCAVWLAQDDVPMQKISQYLGHTSLRMTESVYARYSPSFMKDASNAATF